MCASVCGVVGCFASLWKLSITPQWLPFPSRAFATRVNEQPAEISPRARVAAAHVGAFLPPNPPDTCALP